MSLLSLGLESLEALSWDVVNNGELLVVLLLNLDFDADPSRWVADAVLPHEEVDFFADLDVLDTCDSPGDGGDLSDGLWHSLLEGDSLGLVAYVDGLDNLHNSRGSGKCDFDDRYTCIDFIENVVIKNYKILQFQF